MMDRRTFGAVLATSPWLHPRWLRPAALAYAAAPDDATPFRFGLVTYQWGRDLALPDLLEACRGACDAVELRTTHAHGVEPTLDGDGRRRVRDQFEASSVTLIGLGSDERFDAPDPEVLHRAKDATRAFLQLSHDVGGSGVKVKPNQFHDGVPRARTIEQIGNALKELAPFAADLGQELRLEVHGGCADPRVIRDIMEIADHPAARVCWNSNDQDLRGLGFVDNFDLLRPWFGRTLHVRELPRPDYPHASLLARLRDTRWDGWVLLEAHGAPDAPEARHADLEAQRRAWTAARAALDDDRWQRPVRTRPGMAMTIEAGGAPIAVRRLERLPVLHPIFAAGGRQVVRGFPLAPRDGESQDHPHHVGFWIAHGDVDGHDFWHAPECRVQLMQESLARPVGGASTLVWQCAWMADGNPIVEEARSMTFSVDGLALRLEVDLTLRPVGAAVRFGDTKEGFFALRLTPELKVDDPGHGRLVNEHGDEGTAVWGKRAAWIRAEGTIDGRLVRLRISEDPANFRAPTWWHARTYGLLAANPFGRRAFDGADAEDGAVVITRESPLRLRYAVDVEVV